MKRSRLLAVAVALSLTAALAACGGGGSGGADDGTITLTFRQFDPPAETVGLQKAIDSWNSSHPTVQVKMETLSGADSMQQFAREANSGSGPDVIQIGYVNVKDLAKPKILMPIDDLAAQAAPDTPLDKYLALDMNQFDGKTWGLPWTVDTFALAYNPSVLKAADVSTPPADWTQLAADATKISKTKQGVSGFCFAGASGPSAGQWFAINYYLWSHQASLVTGEGGTWKVGASVDQFRDAIDYFNGLFGSGATAKSMIAVESINDPQLVDGLANGTCGMTMMAPQTFRQARATNDQLITVPMPDGLTDAATHLGGRSLGINASTKHAEQAWAFIRFLNSKEAFTTIEQYPAATTILSDMTVPDGEDGYQQQLPHSQSFARYIGGPIPVATLQKIANSEFGAVYSGQKTSQAAAESLVQQIEAELAKQ